MYTWHVTFADLPAVGDLAGRAQGRLAGLGGLDLVPARWLHLTVQDIGFTDAVPAADVGAIAGAARRHLAGVAAPRVRMGPAHVAAEGVLLDVRPAAGLAEVRSRLRAAIAAVRPAAAVPGPGGWVPHVSIAYSSSSGPAGACEGALAGGGETVDVTIRDVRLIVLGRDQHLYEWSEYARVSLPATGR
jgi:2'-5' RNA ligase